MFATNAGPSKLRNLKCWTRYLLAINIQISFMDRRMDFTKRTVYFLWPIGCLDHYRQIIWRNLNGNRFI